MGVFWLAKQFFTSAKERAVDWFLYGFKLGEISTLN
jgi:hypothetical protein